MKKLTTIALSLLLFASFMIMLVAQRQQIMNQSETIDVLTEHLEKTAQKNSNLVHTNSFLRQRIMELEASRKQNEMDAMPITLKDSKEKIYPKNVHLLR